MVVQVKREKHTKNRPLEKWGGFWYTEFITKSAIYGRMDYFVLY